MRRWREAVAFFYIYKKLYAKSINDKMLYKNRFDATYHL
jgi:hypothetical protein